MKNIIKKLAKILRSKFKIEKSNQNPVVENQHPAKNVTIFISKGKRSLLISDKPINFRDLFFLQKAKTIDGLDELINTNNTLCIEFSDGSRFEGKINKSSIPISGKYTDSNGVMYEGEFSKNGELFAGTIAYLSEVPDKFEARASAVIDRSKFIEFIEKTPVSPLDIFNNFKEVRVSYNNGDVYTGQVSGGNPCGTGKMITSDGNIIQGEFEGRYSLKGTFQDSAGFKLEGTIKNGILCSEGSITCPDGKKLTINFEDSKSLHHLFSDEDSVSTLIVANNATASPTDETGFDVPSIIQIRGDNKSAKIVSGGPGNVRKLSH